MGVRGEWEGTVEDQEVPVLSPNVEAGWLGILWAKESMCSSP